MSALLAAEWLKLRHRWMPRVLVAIMLVIIGLLFWGTATSRQQRPDLLLPHAWVVGLLFSATVAPFIWPILGGSWAGNEYGWGTVRMVLSRRPNRAQFVLAGLLILSAFVALALVAALLFSTLASVVVALLTGNPLFVGDQFTGTLLVTVLKVFLAAWYVLLFYLALSYAAGTLFRSGAVGIGVGIGITLADLIVTGIFFNLGGRWRDIARHFPAVYTQVLPTRAMDGVLTKGFSDLGSNAPGVGETIVALGIYIAVPVLLALVLLRFRDITS